jgi:subtilase family serine protease
VTDVTTNQGAGPAAASQTGFFLSANYQLDASDTPLQSRAVGPLAAGASSSGTTSLIIPAGTASGTYYLIAKTDVPDALPESIETNNVKWVTIKVGPDLQVTSLSAPATAGAGGTIAVTDVTTNQGAGPAAASQTGFFLSANSQLDASDTPLQLRAVGALAAGGSSGGTTAVTIPAGTTAGTYYLMAKTDAPDALPESIETNNVKWVTIKVGPDLQVTALSAPVSGASGGVIAVTETTRNMGAGAAGPSHTAFYLSSNYSLDVTDVPLSPARAAGALAAGGSSSGATNVTLPIVAPGPWYLIAKADDQGTVDETVETNNTRFVMIAIGPDLDVITMTAPSTGVAGTSVAITDTVKNIGPGVASASTTRYYLSLNYAFDGSDTFLGERAVGPLGENATNTGTTTVVLPDGVSGGYYLIAVTDAAEEVPESNEGNNTYWKLITINP